MIRLTGYNELAKLSVFSIEDVKRLTGNEKTAYSLVRRLMNKGLVKKIRQNIYSCVNPATERVIASRYQIACAVNSTAYISHHTAFEFHGVANQVYYDVYLFSDVKFREFEFDGLTFKSLISKFDDGVIEAKNTEGVRVTDIERTVIDSIKDYNKIGGLEELLNCLEAVHYLDENKLKKYLEKYNIQALYQKTGFILQNYMQEMQISKSFIDYCNDKIGKSTRYLLDGIEDKKYYDDKWKLVVPEGLFSTTYKEMQI